MYFRNASIEAAPLQDETILLNPENNQFCMLNRTASFIWNRLGGMQPTDALAAGICSNFSGVSREVAIADIDRTLQQLLSLKFVAAGSEASANGDAEKNSHAPVSVGPTPSELPSYEPPRLTLMKEEEVLSAFQVPVVAASWWG
jgi:hypothetical protein